jgi:membrane fusion protein (multidrug efflux system)
LHSDMAGTSVAGTEASQVQSHDLAERRPLSMRRVRRTLFMLLPIALIAGEFWYVTVGQMISMDDASIAEMMSMSDASSEFKKLSITADVSGFVKEVDVTENQHVEAGQVLYRFHELPFRLALERAEAEIDSVRIDLLELKANHQYVQVLIKQAQNDVNYYLTELYRERSLSNEQVVSQVALDTARQNLRNAQENLGSLNHKLDAITAELNGDSNIPFERHPRYLDARARRDESVRQFAHTVVKAPFAGIVTNVSSIAPGKYLPASTPTLHLIATDRIWVNTKP